jgi:hypothetical protein
MNARIILASLAAVAAISAPALAGESLSTSTRVGLAKLQPQAEKSAERIDTIPANRADFNHSGTVDTQDIFDYLSAWFANRPECDMNGNGVLDGLDILEYINLWLLGPSATVARAG